MPEKYKNEAWIPQAWYDAPRKSDYDYENLNWTTTTQKVKRPWEVLEINDQWAKPETRMACTRFALANIINAQNIIAGKPTISSYDLWMAAVEENPDIKNHGDSMQNALDQARKESLIGWYARVSSWQWIRDAIDAWRFVYTWSRNWNRDSVKRQDVYTTQSVLRVGHIFVWWANYDENWLRGINSYWEENWPFYIKNKYIRTLYTRYAIFPKYEKPIIEEEKQKRDEEAIKKVVDLWIMNGENLDDPVTRRQLHIAIWRMLNR